jgi:hypothetical protein
MLRSVVKWMALIRSDRSGVATQKGDAVESKPSTATYFTLAILSLLVLFVLIWAIVHKRRAALRSRSTSISKDASDAIELYRDLERVLTRMGHARDPSTTPLEHSKRLQQEGFVKADAVETITLRYMQVRFGDQPLSPSEAKRLRAIVSEIRSTDPG